jgi:hypothetical protein
MRLRELKSENIFSREMEKKYHDKIFDRITQSDNELFSHPLKEDILIIHNDIKKLHEEHDKLQSKIFAHNNSKIDNIMNTSEYHKGMHYNAKMLRKMFSSIDTNFIIFTLSLLNLTYVFIHCK